MLSTLLVPLDGSPLAERALPYAEDLARRANGRLILTRAVDGDASDTPDTRQSADSHRRRHLPPLHRREVRDQRPVRPAHHPVRRYRRADRRRSRASRRGHDRHGHPRSRRTGPPLLRQRRRGSAPPHHPPAHAHPRRRRYRSDPPRHSRPARACWSRSTAPPSPRPPWNRPANWPNSWRARSCSLSVITPPPPPAMSELSFAAAPYVDFDLEEAQRESQAYLGRVAQQHGIDPLLGPGDHPVRRHRRRHRGSDRRTRRRRRSHGNPRPFRPRSPHLRQHRHRHPAPHHRPPASSCASKTTPNSQAASKRSKQHNPTPWPQPPSTSPDPPPNPPTTPRGEPSSPRLHAHPHLKSEHLGPPIPSPARRGWPPQRPGEVRHLATPHHNRIPSHLGQLPPPLPDGGRGGTRPQAAWGGLSLAARPFSRSPFYRLSPIASSLTPHASRLTAPPIPRHTLLQTLSTSRSFTKSGASVCGSPGSVRAAPPPRPHSPRQCRSRNRPTGRSPALDPLDGSKRHAASSGEKYPVTDPLDAADPPPIRSKDRHADPHIARLVAHSCLHFLPPRAPCPAMV